MLPKEIMLALCITAGFSTVGSAQNFVRPVALFTADTAVNAAPGKDSFQVDIQTEETGERFILRIDNPLREKLRIGIFSNNGSGYSDFTKDSAYRKRIDLRNAEDGDYVITITGSKRVFTKTLRVATSTEISRTITVRQ